MIVNGLDSDYGTFLQSNKIYQPIQNEYIEYNINDQFYNKTQKAKICIDHNTGNIIISKFGDNNIEIKVLNNRLEIIQSIIEENSTYFNIACHNSILYIILSSGNKSTITFTKIITYESTIDGLINKNITNINYSLNNLAINSIYTIENFINVESFCFATSKSIFIPVMFSAEPPEGSDALYLTNRETYMIKIPYSSISSIQKYSVGDYTIIPNDNYYEASDTIYFCMYNKGRQYNTGYFYDYFAAAFGEDGLIRTDEYIDAYYISTVSSSEANVYSTDSNHIISFNGNYVVVTIMQWHKFILYDKTLIEVMDTDRHHDAMYNYNYHHLIGMYDEFRKPCIYYDNEIAVYGFGYKFSKSMDKFIDLIPGGNYSNNYYCCYDKLTNTAISINRTSMYICVCKFIS